MTGPLEPIEGKYEILEKLHEGGMGSIYRVRHRLLDSVRVIKTMRPQLAGDEEFRARFLREAQVAISLDHPNIAKIYDFSIASDGMAFIVMEFISGLSLRQMLRGMGPPDLPLTLEIARQTLEALGFLHRQGYVHRDIAPDNVMLKAGAERRPQVKLIDLGIAKSVAGGDDLTAAGQFLGKARYSSPEHFSEAGEAGTDARSDVYSFGVVLYELLTGCTPIEGTDLRSLSAGHLYRPPIAFTDSDRDGNVPEDLRGIVLRALAKAPRDRFPDTRVFAEALDHVRLRFPLPELDVEQLFDQIRVSSEIVSSPTSALTQIQLDHQFGQETTPTRGSFDSRTEPRIADLDLPAPEAIIARLDALAGATATPPPAATLPAVTEATGVPPAPPPENETPPSDLSATLVVESEDLRRTQLIDPEELRRTQRIPTLEVPTAAEPPDADEDYQTESTFLPAGEPAPSFAPPSFAPPSFAPPPEPAFSEAPPLPTETATPPGPVPTAADGVAAVEERPPVPPPASAAGRLAVLSTRKGQLVAAAAVLLVLLLFVFGRGRSDEELGAPVDDAVAIPEESEPGRELAALDEEEWLAAAEVHPALILGRRCLIAGDPVCAVIAAKTVEAESLSLAPQELELLGDLRVGLEASLGGAGEATDPRSLGERLVDALENGPVTELRDVFDAIMELRQGDPDAFVELSEPIGRAGDIVGEWRRMWRLKRSRDHLGVVRTASRLAELYPPYAGRSLNHRDEAAAAIETQADGLAAGGDLGTARARLAELRQILPGREGLRAKIVALDRRLSEGREIEAVIARAEAAFSASDPHRGLELLEQISIADGSRYSGQVADLRERLQRRLLDMDRQPPVIRELADAEYRRNDPATIPLEISDDYRVETVRAWARAGKDGAFSEVAVHHEGGTSYVVEVLPAVHDNKRNLEFYVWVADRSGHTATLGTESAPRSLRRKGLF